MIVRIEATGSSYLLTIESRLRHTHPKYYDRAVLCETAESSAQILRMSSGGMSTGLSGDPKDQCDPDVSYQLARSNIGQWKETRHIIEHLFAEKNRDGLC